ncbi:hypothetical protein KKB44_04840 [Candidatus Micrarchaeota archaeon]|nr:hypothetical protein [Candidatus Micrarchaeota archaeon]
MKRIFFFLFIVSLASAILGPQIYEQKNLGYYAYPEFLYSLGVDCDNGEVHLNVMDTNMSGVEGTKTYLQYIDFASPLLSSASTGEDGFVKHKLPGNVTFMRGLFMLRIEKNGYRSKEIHFDILCCLANESWIAPIANNTKQTIPSPQEPPLIQNPVLSNNSTNQTESEEETAPELCIPALLPLLILFKRKQIE